MKTKFKTDTRPSRPVPTVTADHWEISEQGIGYRCELRISREGDFYVGYVSQLDSAVSQGDSLEACIKNVIDAFKGCIETYKAERMSIPWTEPKPKEEEETSYWAVVDV